MVTTNPIRAKQGANLGGAYAHNRRVVIDALRVNGALSRAELARATALTGQTVSNIVAELSGEGLVAADAPVRIARGQPARPYRLVAEGAFAIGVQIDRHVTRAVAVDLLGTERLRLDAALPSGGPETGLPVVADLVAATRQRLSALVPSFEARLVGLGLAMPGPFGQAFTADDPWMMSAWQNRPIARELAEAAGLDVTLQNDAAAAATAEKLSGAARGIDDFVYLHFGYGLGAAIFVRGEIHPGHHRNAGEIGMALPFMADGAVGEPIEHGASLAALCRHLKVDPAAPDLFAAIDAAVGRGDADVWLDAAGASLRWVVQILETLLDPDTIVFGGAVPPSLLEALRRKMEPLLPSHADRPGRALPRLTTGRADPWMVAIGAAAEPIARNFDPRFSAIQNVSPDG
ncbi:ROK family transcriptional regulator [Aurantimonas sp. 22II-16-19i]|uniref:ROK family transcriptional regulator n=1 Tax=Aurantimonas sp. 22II-16-19i TaxID=1317114 RepID=UPI0009F7C62D|nr:ROK family transcriptional regulator [Aurantimonas sp. 22II-16-19i]ORE91272.1 ROK family protein [Aurantimonas sp. 22II-16-19i]